MKYMHGMSMLWAQLCGSCGRLKENLLTYTERDTYIYIYTYSVYIYIIYVW